MEMVKQDAPTNSDYVDWTNHIEYGQNHANDDFGYAENRQLKQTGFEEN